MLNYIKISLFLFNLSSNFCFKIDSINQLKISKLQLFLNVLKLSLVPIFLCFLKFNENARKRFFRGSINEGSKKEFSILIFELAMCCITITIISVQILQILRRRKIMRFMEKLRKIKLSEQAKRKIIRKCFVNYVAILLFLIIDCSMIFAMFTAIKTPFGILIFISSCFPQLLIFSFMILLKCIQDLLILDLQETFDELSRFILNNCDEFKFQKLSLKIDFISSIFDDFEQVFGYQLTLISLTITILNVTYVSKH